MSQKVVFYLAHAADQLTLVSSADATFNVTSFADSDGSERWTQTTEWLKGKGDHGKAMSRPAIVGDRLFVRPAVSVTCGRFHFARNDASGTRVRHLRLHDGCRFPAIRQCYDVGSGKRWHVIVASPAT